MLDKKPICYAPFLGLYADYTGKYAPCCVSKKVEVDSLDKYWSDETIKSMREQLANHQWPDECSYCKNRVEQNLETDIISWKKIANKIENLELNIENGNQTRGPVLLDFRPGNKCNLKCRMCGPKFSNLWNDEIKNNKELKKWLSPFDSSENNKLYEFIKYSEKLDLIQIKVLGGEPTIDENVLLFLENMVSNKNKLPQLNFTTNGTNLNKRFNNIIKKFKDLHIIFSVDAVGKEYEYIRTNASWNKVKRNIENSLKEDIAKDYTFNIILMPYNIFSINELLEWIVSLYDKNYYFSLTVDTSEAIHTSLSAVLPEDIEYAIKNLEEFIPKINPKFFKEIYGANDFLRILKATKFNKDEYLKFKEYNNLLDKIRSTSLLSIDKRFSKYV
jgi:MoaA/NifB/PqqE/SkfB family radical SAM enzyme